ncbi:MAG: TetR/AcrR family transcriptional regulator [Bacilli bacterium]|nr:TetR/AcrR family transcriptional regulator [Bacilli bacterium]
MAKIDRRFIKSENEILKAFSALLNRYELADISIQDLVEEADINKSTFYLHYSNLGQVLNTLQDKLITDVFEIYQSSDGDFCLFLVRLIDGIKKSRKIYRTVLLNSTQYFFENIYSIFWGSYSETDLKNKHLDVSIYSRMSLIHSLCNILLLWCQGGCVSSKEEVIERLNRDIEHYLK